ncbi:MAG: hypothetical protein WAN20_25515 [Pseudonocardiaceae bacterium]|jgi:xylulose-5-phosphate/fructose-6-phosphate phosphoketolase|nr:hypothetical protein [Pseudonocardiaceae bacterium]
MVVLRTPKGWTGPIEVDGQQVEGTFRSHQVPLPGARTDPSHLAALDQWLRSYQPEELFDEAGRPVPELLALSPVGARRISANPHANGGVLLRDLELPDWHDYAVDVPAPGTVSHEATRVVGTWLRDIVAANPSSFLITAPDELANNRLEDMLDVTGRRWDTLTGPGDDRLDPAGRDDEPAREVARVDREDPLAPAPGVAELPAVVARVAAGPQRVQPPGPGFLDVVMNKKPEIVRVYLPPDANTLLSTYDHCLRSRHYVNAQDAELHCARGLGIWAWAGTEDPGGATGEPDVVLACAGDVPTLETLAAAALVRRRLPELCVRVVNVVDLMRLLPESKHPHGLPDREFDAIFTPDRPVIFAFHGYPHLVHRLTYARRNHAQLHVHGYQENGTTTTPFDMVMLNDLDRFSLVIDVIDRVPDLGTLAAGLRQEMVDTRLSTRAYTRRHGEDAPEIAGWTWPG